MSEMEKKELFTRITGMNEEEQMIAAAALSDEAIISALTARMMKLHYFENQIKMMSEDNKDFAEK